MTALQKRLHSDIAEYCARTRRTTNESDPGVRQATEHFLQQLEQAPTTTAQLVVLGAELCGLPDTPAVYTAARAILMTHVAAHMNTQNAHERAAAGTGMHVAHILLANLDAPQELRIKMLSITNRALMLYNQAQTYRDQTTALDSYATELALNPLHVGMVLANADCAATDAITPFALVLGRFAHAHDPRDLQQAEVEKARITMWPQDLLQNIQRTIITS